MNGTPRNCSKQSAATRPSRFHLLAKLFTTVLLSFISAICMARAGAAGDGTVRIMTQNMYQGTNFDRILSATTPEEFVVAVTETYNDILATKPAERAAAVARTIARERPDVVALLETTLLRTGNPPATGVESDQLNAVLSELRRLGQQYEAVAILPGTDSEAPTLLGFDVRVTDRTAIIVRTSLAGARLRTTNMQVQDYLVNSVVNLPIGQPSLSKAGWASVDITVLGRTIRFVATHLEVIPPFTTQRTQALELIKAATNTTLPVILAGDFNAVAGDPSHPTFATYQLFVEAGFADAWKQKYPSLPGYTCCQAANLLNATSTLSTRIDLVLLRGAVSVEDVKIVGDRASDRTLSGLWPSDHAGLVATLRVAGD